MPVAPRPLQAPGIHNGAGAFNVLGKTGSVPTHQCEERGVPDARRLEERQKVLADFGEFALRSDDLDAVLAQACRLVAEALGTGHAKVLEIEHESRTLFVRAGVGWDEGIVGRLRLPMGEHSSETYSIAAGEPVITNDLATEDRFDFPAFLKEAGVRALANVPVYLPGGKPFGLLQVDASEPRAFDDNDSQFLRTYATILGPVIDRLLKLRALHATEARFRAIVEAARDYAIILTDAEDRITDWLPGAEAVFGWTAAEAIGQPGAMLFTPEDRHGGAPETELEAARAHGSTPDVRWHVRKDGSRVFIQGTVVALLDEAGGLRGFQKIGQDVTRSRLAEEALRESEARHSLLIGSLAQAVWETDGAGVVVADSPSWRAHTGQTLEEWLGYGWLDAIHPDDRAFAERQWREATAAGGLVNAEFRLRAPDGGWRWTNVRAAPVLDAEGTVRKWAGMNIDIDTRKRAEAALLESEARYRTLFESMDEGYLLSEVIFDENDKAIDIVFLEANPAAVRLAGRDFTGQNMREIDPRYEEYWYEAFGQVALTGESLRAEHYAEPHGRWFDFQLTKVGPPDSRRVVSIYHDVTERRRAEQALRESEEKYRTLFDSIDEGFCVIEVLFDDAGRPTDYVFLETNGAFERQTGLADATGRRMRDLAPDHESHWFEIYGQIALSGEPQRFEQTARALGRWYDVYAFRIGRPEQRRVAILFNDIGERKQAERALQESEERQAFLLALSDALRPLAHSEDIQATTARLLGAHLGVDRAMYAEVTGEPGSEAGVIRGQFLRPAAPGRPAPAPFPDHFTYQPFGAEVMAKRYAGEGLAVADVNTDPGFDAAERAAWAAVGVRAAIVAPLVKGGRLVAELGVHSETSRAWTDAEIALVHEVGERTWAAAERARAEAALAESEEKHRTLFETMGQGFCELELVRDAQGRAIDQLYLELNPAFERLFGTPVSSAKGRTASVVFPDLDPVWTQHFSSIVAAGEPQRIEHRFGSDRWFEAYVYPGKGDRLAVLYEEVTDRKHAEQALRASEERFRLLLESVRDYAIFTMDRDGMITSWPAGAATVYGWSEEEILGRSADLTFLPEDLRNGVPAEERRMAASEGLAPNVRWHRRKDGTHIFIDGSTQPLVGADGQVHEFIKIGQDVTEARRTQQALAEGEQRLRTLTEGIPQLVWRSGDGGRWTWSSPQWQAFTGQSLAESLGLGWLEALHPEDRDAAMQAWAGAQASGAIDVEYRVRRAPDGEYLWHHTRSLPVRNERGDILEWLGTTTDVQQLKELQERQTVMVAELQHRTRNLIAVVRSIAQQTMAETGPTQEFREEFNHRLAALARVQGLLSRSDEEPITIETLIRMELDALGAKPEPGRIELEGPSARIRHSVVQTLALALHELATNARKYGALSSEEGRLQVRWRVESNADGDRLALEWTETGGQPPKPQSDARRGYGRELIERALPYSLDARTAFEHDATGLRCTIDMPLKRARSRRMTA